MKFNVFFIVIVMVVLLFATSSPALEIQYENSPNVLLSRILGPGGQGSSPWIIGSNRGMGTYSNNSNLWGIGSGIVLSSGDIGYFGDGPNTSANWSVNLGQPGDNDLTDLSGYQTYDASKFGFDFTASSDSISFDFVFCSEEFDEYVNSGFNDVFGVWLEDSSGNKSQISFDDNNNPITINRAWMSGGNPPNNSTGTELDGCTVPLRTTASVAKGQNYRIKFSIADASDEIYDSTVYIGNFKGASPLVEQKKMYGLFIGYRQTSDKYDEFRGDLSAQKVKNSFLKLNNAVYAQMITGNMATGGIPQSQIESAINEVKSKMKDGDILFFYIASHGFSDLIGPETTTTFGDEVLKVGPATFEDENFLTDDELYSALEGMDGINKWVIIDACESGGFWGNNNSYDEGDLEKLKNIYFMASAEEGKNAGYDHDGVTIFAKGIERAMALDNNGKATADANKDGILPFEELFQCILQDPEVAKYEGTIVGKMELGDPVLFSLDMWTPVGYKNVDFETNLYPLVNPNPDTDPTGNHPPSANAGPDQMVERTSTAGAAVTLDGSGSSDPDGDALVYEWTWSGGSASGVNPTVTLPMGLTTITLTVSDGEASNTDTVDITVVDTTSPTASIIIPEINDAVQDGVTLTAEASDISGVASVSFFVREPDGGSGVPIGMENLAGTFNASTGKWEYNFDTTQLQDGYYVVLAKATDTYGNEGWSTVVPFSIRNWAVITLLPSTANSKAGRTMPVKFALRVAASVDPNMPFVYNDDLEIRIYKASNPGNILQASRYGDSTTDYRIISSSELYITNFKTLKSPAEYVVEIWRINKNWMVGSFTFKTVK